MRTFALALFLVAVSLTGQAEDPMRAQDIVRKSDELARRLESYAKVTMQIERPDWSRTLVLEGWTQGASNSFMRVLSPRKEKDVTFLKRGREAWQYVPSVDRTIKIPPSMMLQSWMGSDFTNDDVVRADSLVVDYTHAIVEEPEEEGIRYWVIEALPFAEAPVVWGKVMLRIRQHDFVADRVDYYDEDDERVKYYQTFDIRVVDGLAVATRFTMYDLANPGYSTTLTYDDLSFSPDLKPGVFTVRNLKR